MVGFEDIAQARLRPDSIAQHWATDQGFASLAVQQGMKLIMSPADKAYMDMKYTPSTTLGLIFHAAEHSSRHAGQVVTLSKIARA